MIVSLTPIVASAQAGGAAPPPVRSPSSTKSLDFRLSLHEAYDRSQISGLSLDPALDPQFRHGAGFTAADASISFFNSSPRVSFRAVGASNVRHFSAAPELLRADYYGALNVSKPFGRGLTGRAAQRISYSPYYSFGEMTDREDLAPDDVLQPDQTVARLATHRARTSAGLTWKASGRTSVNAGYSLDVVDTAQGAHSSLSQGANLGVSRRLTEYADLRLGYGYRRSQSGQAAEPFETHDLGTGFGYRRPLSFSRRTLVSFNTGAALVVARSKVLTLTGSGSLSHQLARTWTTALTYNRGVTAFAGLSQPYAVDSVAGTLGGLVTKKLVLSLSTGYTRGRVLIGIDNGVTSVFGRGRLQYALSRYLPIFGEYVYYQYSFARATGLGASFPLSINRHGFRGGLSYSMPLLGRRVTR